VRIVDLSVPLEASPAEPVRPKVDVEDHEREYCRIEKLHNLGAPPGAGFTISCLPVKIAGASAGWCRAVAVVDGA